MLDFTTAKSVMSYQWLPLCETLITLFLYS